MKQLRARDARVKHLFYKVVLQKLVTPTKGCCTHLHLL